MRTYTQLVEHCGSVDDGLFGFERGTLLEYVAFADARPYLKDDATAEQWGDVKPLTHEQVLADLHDYLPFAIEKAEDERGLSAIRSISRMRAWVWLLGDDDLYAFLMDDDNYSPYGMPMLRRIEATYGETVAT